MKQKINIMVLGDICPRYLTSEQFNTGSTEAVFHDILQIISAADVTIANLEAPATKSDVKLEKNSINLKAVPEDIKLLAKAGIQGFALANNHILDYGMTGLEDTIDILRKNNIFHYGIESTPYCIRNVAGLKIGFVAFAEREFNCAEDYGDGAVLWDDLKSPITIRKIKDECDFLVVQYHGGIEHYIYPSPYLQKKCRAMADAGADFITCQHSHCIGTREKWNNAEILYGQGNTVFGYSEGDNSWNEGLLVKLDLFRNKTGNICSEVKYIPIEAGADGERLMPESQSSRLLSKFNDDSQKITSNEFVRNQWAQFCMNQRDCYLPMLFSRGRMFNKLNRITKGKLIQLLTKKTNRRNTMNLIRCDAHREVVQTLLEQDWYGFK